MNTTRTLIVLATAVSLSACTLADEFKADEQAGVTADYSETPVSAVFRETAAGTILTTPEGMTVYTYDKEVPGSPSCYGGCAEDWSPVIAPPNAKASGELTLLDRVDGAQQWAYQDLALYTYDGDKKPGDITGDNQDGGVWHVVKARD